MSSEMVILAPFYNTIFNTLFKEPDHCIGNNNKGRLDDVFKYGNDYIEYGTITECDIVIIPYKWRGRDNETLNIINDAYSFGKPVATFINSDSDEFIDISPCRGFIFRTSLYRSIIENQYSKNKVTSINNIGTSNNNKDTKKNVITFALPAFSPDTFNNNFINYTSKQIPTIGYCGHGEHGRFDALNIIKKSNLIKTDFILRTGFWAPELPKIIAKKEFISNIEKNLFTFCTRGGGNFSYRFYETLSMGRIPVLLDTDSVIPFIDTTKTTENCIIVKSPYDVEQEIMNFCNTYDINKIQRINRKLWEDYLSPLGFVKQLSILLQSDF